MTVYNQATTESAVHSNETSKDKLSIISNCYLLLSSRRTCQTTQKLVHFYLLITLNNIKVVKEVYEKPVLVFLVLHPVGSVSLGSFVLLERPAVLLASTLAVNC